MLGLILLLIMLVGLAHTYLSDEEGEGFCG